MLALQLELVEAVVNARHLVQPGVSYVSFGPTDLGFSLDMHPAFPLRTVEDCMSHVSAQLRGSGVPLGLAVNFPPRSARNTWTSA